MVTYVRGMVCSSHVKRRRAAAILMLCVILVSAGSMAPIGRVSAQDTLYNGVVLPPDFLQPKSPTQAFRQPSYLVNPPAVIPINIGRQLFVDDFLIQDTNLQRTPHQPVLYSGNPVLTVGGRDNNSVAFPYSDGVWYDSDSNLFKMWYDGGYGNDIAYAYSSDGKNWVKPNIPDAAVPDSNLVLVIGGGRDSDTVWRDAFDPDPSRRYKAFALYNIPQFYFFFSGDGIHWNGPQPNNMNSLSDRTTVFYNPFRGVWVESARQTTTLPATVNRPSYDARARYYAESRDLVNWTDPSNVFWTGPDELDPPYAGPGGAYPELYNLDAVAYESVMVGLFSWFNPGPSYKSSYGPGPNLVELGVGFSRDGYQWVRPTRGFGPNAFIPASNVDGSWNCCNTQSAGGGFLVVGDQLWFYFSARSARKPATGIGSTGLATLRRDGFYSMDANGYEGTLTTRPVLFSGNHLFVNAAAGSGRVQAEILDTNGNVIAPFSRSNSTTVSSDTTRSEIGWSGGDLASVANRAVKVRFYVSNASLYAFWVTPSAAGASYGYVAAGGPGFSGATDNGGGTSAPPPPAPPPPAPTTSGPSVAITSPASGSTVAGLVVIEANASDPAGIAGVLFRIDGANMGGEIASPPYRFDWNSAPWWNGVHTITAIARNAAGKTSSATVTVTTANGGGIPAPPFGQALRYVPIAPCRMADTRSPTGPFGGPAFARGASRDFNVPASGCGIPINASAYSVNIAVVPLGPLGYLSAWPAGQAQLTSTLDSLDGRIRANAAIVPAGVNGAITIFASNATHVVIDISGYFIPANGDQNLAFYPIVPCRLADTRNPFFGGPALPPGSARTFPVASGACGIPASAQAYVLNLTAIPSGPLGYLSVWPAGSPLPGTSTLNAPTGAITSNMAVVGAGAGGAINVLASNPSDVTIDITGYFAPPGPGSLDFYTVRPCRIVDTRGAVGPSGGPALAGGQSRDFPVSSSGCNIPATAKVYSLNAVLVPAAPVGTLTLWAGGAIPGIPTLSSYDASVAAEAAFVPASPGGAVTAIATNSTHLVIDINGYFQ